MKVKAVSWISVLKAPEYREVLSPEARLLPGELPSFKENMMLGEGLTCVVGV